MKSYKENIKRLEEYIGDNEVFHQEYDYLIHDRLKELDPEFVDELDKLRNKVIFWYV